MRRGCWERFPRHQLQRQLLVSDLGMHHGTCVTHVPWCMSGSLTRGDGKNVPGIPGACTTRNFIIWQEAHGGESLHEAIITQCTDSPCSQWLAAAVWILITSFPQSTQKLPIFGLIFFRRSRLPSVTTTRCYTSFKYKTLHLGIRKPQITHTVKCKTLHLGIRKPQITHTVKCKTLHLGIRKPQVSYQYYMGSVIMRKICSYVQNHGNLQGICKRASH